MSLELPSFNHMSNLPVEDNSTNLVSVAHSTTPAPAPLGTTMMTTESMAAGTHAAVPKHPIFSGWGPVFNFLWGISAMQLVIALVKSGDRSVKKSQTEGKSLEELIKEKERLEDLISKAAAQESSD